MVIDRAMIGNEVREVRYLDGAAHPLLILLDLSGFQYHQPWYPSGTYT